MWSSQEGSDLVDLRRRGRRSCWCQQAGVRTAPRASAGAGSRFGRPSITSCWMCSGSWRSLSRWSPRSRRERSRARQLGVDGFPCGLGEDDLAPVGSRADPRGPMDVETDVPLASTPRRYGGRSGRATASSATVRGEGPGPGRPRPPPRPGPEDDEDRVAFGLHPALRAGPPPHARRPMRSRGSRRNRGPGRRSWVDPSMSENMSVRVPVGSSTTITPVPSRGPIMPRARDWNPGRRRYAVGRQHRPPLKAPPP